MNFFLHVVRGRKGILGCILLLMVAGLFDLRSLPVEPVPDISPRQVLVTIQAPGLPTEEVEKLVTFPIETVLSGVVGLKISDRFPAQACRFCIFNSMTTRVFIAIGTWCPNFWIRQKIPFQSTDSPLAWGQWPQVWVKSCNWRLKGKASLLQI